MKRFCSDEHLKSFITAVQGKAGSLDAWLEMHNEEEVRSAVKQLQLQEHEWCIQVATKAIKEAKEQRINGAIIAPLYFKVIKNIFIRILLIL